VNTAVPLGGSAVLLSHHVDGLEVSCSVPYVPLLLGDRREQLDPLLERARARASIARPCIPVPLNFVWPYGPDGDEPVLVHLGRLRRNYAYALETSAWLMFVGSPRSPLPRFLVQFRAATLLVRGGAEAFRLTRDWWDETLLPLVGGRPDDEEPQWRVSRLDLTADVGGLSLVVRDVEFFTSRAGARRTFEDRDEWEAATAK
jgi:hypothetical protein